MFYHITYVVNFFQVVFSNLLD